MKPNTELVQPIVSLGYKLIGRIQPKHANDIPHSCWSIGCETTDRGYVHYKAVAPYLGALGAKHVRIQAGWAYCDTGVGKPYNWDLLDTIVDDALSQGVQPWLQVSYGNPAYSGGGGIGLSQGIPTSEEALKAWDKWVSAIVQRYQDRVSRWEIWNEPSNEMGEQREYIVQPEDFAVFHLQTARMIRQVQLGAKLVGLVIGYDDGLYTPRFYEKLKELGGLDTVDEACVHGYANFNPDDDYESIEHFFRVSKEYISNVAPLQGEAGSNSESGTGLAMWETPWTERKQAVWNMRRMLGHHARGIPMNLFQLSDMNYKKEGGALFDLCNTKGLLRTYPDNSVAYRKPSYFAAQHIFTLFDGRVDLKRLKPYPVRARKRISIYCWEAAGTPVILAWWNAMFEPDLYLQGKEEEIGLDAIPVEDPVLVDLLSGAVFELPDALKAGNPVALQKLPMFDSPLALIQRDWFELQNN